MKIGSAKVEGFEAKTIIAVSPQEKAALGLLSRTSVKYLGEVLETVASYEVPVATTDMGGETVQVLVENSDLELLDCLHRLLKSGNAVCKWVENGLLVNLRTGIV
jgi:hypothetical protein